MQGLSLPCDPSSPGTGCVSWPCRGWERAQQGLQALPVNAPMGGSALIQMGRGQCAVRSGGLPAARATVHVGRGGRGAGSRLRQSTGQGAHTGPRAAACPGIPVMALLPWGSRAQPACALTTCPGMASGDSNCQGDLSKAQKAQSRAASPAQWAFPGAPLAAIKP